MEILHVLPDFGIYTQGRTRYAIVNINGPRLALDT